MSQQPVEPHVFISHKARDKNAAMALKQILLRSCSDLHVFVSSDAHDMPNGHEWRAEIHRNLEAAHWLILLYTDPTDNWDWCLYECGYHASRIRTGEPMSRKLTVLCPQGITPPAPLTEWQLTQSDLRAIDTLLQELGHCIRTDVTKLDDAKRMKLAREIKSLVDNLHVSYSQSCGWLEITAPMDPAGGLAPGIEPGKFMIKGDEKAAQAVGIAGNKAVALSKVPKVRAVDVVERFDYPCLMRALSQAADETALIDPPVLPAIFSEGYNKSYRPVIQRTMLRRADPMFDDSPSVTLQLMMVPVAPSSRVPPGAADSMHNLLTSAKQFRWRVIDEYAQDFRDMVDSGTVTDEQWRRLRNMTEEIDRAVRESNGLQLNNTMYELFTPEGRIRIAESTQDWNPCLTKLQRIISSPASVSPSKLVTELVECFETMRRINRALFEQACTEFSGKLPNYFFLDKELRPRLQVTIGEAVTRRTDPDNHPPVAAAP